MSVGRSTLIGFSAILMWAFLATLTVAAQPVPPFQLNALCFGIGAVVGLVWILVSGQGLAVLRNQPLLLWVTGVLGLFLSHTLYFTAMSMAPPAQVSLIAYLWPLLIVLFSGLLPEEHLRASHIAGALVAFAGAAMIVGGDGSFSPGFLPGYLVALVYAAVWAGYSVFSRRFRSAPAAVVTVYCAGTAVLSALAHAAFETTTGPAAPLGWLAILALGIGPVGIAFFLWDHGMKHGNIRLLGTASYAAPVLSTLLLVATGQARFTPALAAGAALVASGAWIASRPSRAEKPAQ